MGIISTSFVLPGNIKGADHICETKSKINNSILIMFWKIFFFKFAANNDYNFKCLEFDWNDFKYCMYKNRSHKHKTNNKVMNMGSKVQF